MIGTESERDWFLHLMAINEQAFTAGHYQIAYHALMSALHTAKALGDPVALRRVEQVATAQQDRIDTESPEHRFSTQKAGLHGVLGLFRMAARQAAARAIILARRSRTTRP